MALMKKAKEKIVFLDAGTLDYGDVSFKELHSLGKLKIYPKTPAPEILKRCQSASIVITNKCVFNKPILNRLKGLKLICIAATGTNNVDLKAARAAGIAVANVSGYSTESVVQCTFAFLLALAGNLLKFNQAAHDGRWSRSVFFTLADFPFHEINGKTLGIVGYGRIGKRVAQVAKAFGMKVLIAKIPGREYSILANRVPLDTLVQKSDFLTLHAPLSGITQNLINSRLLRKIKKDAYLINMARGGLVDEKALAHSLKSGRLAGAAADVLAQEPPPKNHVLLKAPHFLLTPHVAWASVEARKRLVHEIAQNIRAFQHGKIRNRIV